MSPHGPDAETFGKATSAELAPQRLGDTLAFMFESRYVYQPTPAALDADFRQRDYVDVWAGLRSHFTPDQR